MGGVIKKYQQGQAFDGAKKILSKSVANRNKIKGKGTQAKN